MFWFLVVLCLNAALADYADVTLVSSSGEEFYEASSIYAQFSQDFDVQGILHSIFLEDSTDQLSNACQNLAPVNISQIWIALVSRGDCSFVTKAENVAVAGASAMIVVDTQNSQQPVTMGGQSNNIIRDLISVAVTSGFGETLKDFSLRNSNSTILLKRSESQPFEIQSWLLGHLVLFAGTMALVTFVAVIGAAWRAHHQRRNRRQHIREVQDILTTIPTREYCLPNSRDDAEVQNKPICAVCLDELHPGDILRTLPCSHEMHKECVDPWLLEHSTCPCCRLNIRDSSESTA